MDIRYLAGFFDADGSVGIYATTAFRGRYHLAVSISQNSRGKHILEAYERRFGGGVSLLHKKGMKENWSEAWQWRCYADTAVEALITLAPYLTLKKEEAEVAIEWQTTKIKGKSGAGNKRCTAADKVYSDRLKELKHV